ncbi:MAG: TIGR00266 family protein [Deltaproteobacteria bacterium]|nr:TIGR00266 family protein [Deltaproteobacteria bacterium]
MTQWYLSYDDQQVGPLDEAQAAIQARQHPQGYAWREGFTAWVPVAEIVELASGTAGGRPVPPPPPGTAKADEIDFKIFGAEMQFVEVELDPGESVIAEAGAMMYKDSSIVMETIFGDGSGSGGGGLMDKLLGAGKRLLTGESLFMTVFTHNGPGKGHAAFGAPYPGNIIPIPLPSVGGTLICQKDSFLCAAKGVAIGIFFQRRILTGLFGGEGFIMQKLEGNGIVFVHAGGTMVERRLGPGEMVHVDTGCIVALEPTVDFDIQQAGGIKTALFGGEGLFLATLRGPGRIWLQSLPFSRLAGRMLQAAPQRGGRKEEGSILGSLGGLLDGDNR